MASPVKALTYLPRTYLVATGAILPVRRVLCQASDAPVRRLLRPLWRRIAYAVPQVVGPSAFLPPWRVVSRSVQAMRMMLYWRNPQGRPPRGQLWPRTR